jgi:hypothetical protein
MCCSYLKISIGIV